MGHVSPASGKSSKRLIKWTRQSSGRFGNGPGEDIPTNRSNGCGRNTSRVCKIGIGSSLDTSRTKREAFNNAGSSVQHTCLSRDIRRSKQKPTPTTPHGRRILRSVLGSRWRIRSWEDGKSFSSGNNRMVSALGSLLACLLRFISLRNSWVAGA